MNARKVPGKSGIVLKVLRAALCPLACGIYEGEVGPTGKVGAISTSGTLGLSVILQHRVNESCEDVKRPDSGRLFKRKSSKVWPYKTSFWAPPWSLHRVRAAPPEQTGALGDSHYEGEVRGVAEAESGQAKERRLGRLVRVSDLSG